MLDTLSRIFRLHTMKHRLRFWVSALVVVLGILILTSLYVAEVQSRTRETNDRLKETLEFEKLAIESWISDHSGQIRFLSRSLSGHDVNKPAIMDSFRTFINTQDQFSAVVYAGPDGWTSIDSDASGSVNISDRSYFKAAQEGKEFVSDIIIGKTSGTPIVIFSSPVKDAEGRFGGIVFGSIHIETLEQMIRVFDVGTDSGEHYLLDRTGMFITTPLREPVSYLGKSNGSAAYDRALHKVTADKPYRNYKGEEVLGQSAWTKEGQWVLVAEIRRSSVLKPLYWKMATVSGIIFVVLLVSLWLVVALSRRMEQPLQLLLKGTKIIRDGNYDYRIDPDSIRSAPVELKQLCETYNIMAQKLESTIRMLEQTAVVDQLTEVYNRRFILKEGSKLLETCIRAHQPCSVLMIDIDYFKRVNDTYGHLVGDRVIIYAASVLMSCIRQCDMVSRYGGEEFLILAPNTQAEPGGLQLGERVRHTFEEHPYQEDGLLIPLTVSIGVSDYRLEGGFGANVLEDMISRADKALYSAKRNGRNRVESISGSLDLEEEEDWPVLPGR